MSEEEPPEKKDQQSSKPPGEARKSVPVGRRVVRKKRRSKGGTRETLTLKKREILSELADSQVPEGAPVNVREQVDRLRRAQKEQRAADSGGMEERWGDRTHRRRGSRWLILAVFAVVIPVLALVVALSLSGTGGGDQELGESLLNLDEEQPLETFDTTDPVTWFHENSVEAFEEAKGILRKINEGETAESNVGLMRNSDRALRRIRETGFEWTSDFETNDPRYISWQYGAAGNTGWMAVMGRDSTFSPFRAYFVNTADGLRLDWEATTAYSQLPIASLVETAPRAPVMVRCWISKKPQFDYSGEGPESLFSWYQILDETKENYVWAYAIEGGEIDLELKEMFGYGRFVVDLMEETRGIVTLRVGGPGRRPNQFELVEFVTQDWVQP